MSSVPSVLAILLCDSIIVEQGSNKKTLVGVFTHVNAASFPALLKMGFYARLTDLEGDYRFEVRIVRLEGNAEDLMAGAETEFKADDRLAILDLALNLPPMPFPGPGRYEFQLFADSVYIGRATLYLQPLR